MNRTPRRILIIKPSSLGDIVHALPILAGARETWPAAHVAWLVGAPFAPLLACHPLLDEVIPFDRKHYGHMLRQPRAAADFARFVRDLHRRRFDLVLDLQGLFRSGFLAWASGARQRVGFASARELAPAFYTRRVRCAASDQHAVAKNLRLGRAAGLARATPAFPLGLTETEQRAAQELLTAANEAPLPTFCALLPGARWDSKQWPRENWSALIDQLREAGLPRCVLLGGPDEKAAADAIASAATAPVVNLVGRTSLRLLAAVLAQSRLVVCQDSGPMHIAAALDKPLVAIFGPTNPARTGPYSHAARIVARGLPCVPCYRRQCPLGHHDCLRGLSVAEVAGKVRETYAETASAAATRPVVVARS